MTPKIRMPIVRQVPLNPDGPLLRRLLGLSAPVVYEIVEQYEYETLIEGKAATLVLPAGFRSDLASTPRVSWLFGLRPDGVLCLGGWFHDFYYRHGFLLACTGAETEPWPHFSGKGKLWADRMLAKITATTAGLKTPGWVAMAALAAFGWFAWRGNAEYREIASSLPSPGYNVKTLHGEYDDHEDD